MAACGLVLALVLSGASARAADYGLFVDIETEEDLLDLLTSEEISESAFETLRELLQGGVDLSTADRERLYTLPNLTYADVDAILAYRKEAGHVRDPAALVTAGALSEKKLGAIAPFLILRDQKVRPYDTKGRLRYGTTFMSGDRVAPSMFLQARVQTLRQLDLGLTMMVTRTWVGSPVYDPNRDALAATPPKVRFKVPKFHAQWNTDKFQVLVGSFRIGFGQRLIFDNTGQYNPNGIRVDDTLYITQGSGRACRESQGELAESPCAGDLRYKYQSPDYRFTNRLRGVAFGLKKISVGKKHWMQVYGFASMQTHSIYQYQIYDRARCSDPRNDSDPNCSAPYVFRILSDRLAPTSRYSYSSLPDMYNELLAGGNVTYFFSRRNFVGVTGYGSSIQWLVDGIDLDFQEWARIPFGGPFGAVGVNAAWGHDFADLFMEVGHTFDNMPSKGGLGAILRAVFTIKKQELELSTRYYDKGFANPHSRPISAPDQYEGLRARDELGFRAKYSAQLKDVQVRTLADYWAEPSSWTHKLRLRTRLDYEVATWFRPGVWVDYQDRDLSHTGRDNCYAQIIEYDWEGEPIACRGEKIDVGLQLKFQPIRMLTLTAYYQHRFTDDGNRRFLDSFRMDSSAWLLAMIAPTKDLRIRARVRYRYWDIQHNDYLEHSLWTYLEVAWWYKRMFRVKGRLEVMKMLDRRESSLLRHTDPEVWARLELEYRF